MKWEDMVVAQEVGAVAEAVVPEVLVVHVVAVLGQERQVNHLQVVIIVPIMIDLADYMPVIQVIEILVPKVHGVLELYLH